MFLGAIASNMSSGLSGAAVKMQNSKWFNSDFAQVTMGRHAYNDEIIEKYRGADGKHTVSSTLKAMGHIGVGNMLGSDYKHKGTAAQIGVAAYRQGVGIAVGMPLEAGLRAVSGTGDFTTKNGERDIAGIPFI